ncbi:DUF4124 domain-containing protein [Marinihelvus fidelis]|nr:DUF4124 domain-containing protein [Marinihelvus fidelis]
MSIVTPHPVRVLTLVASLAIASSGLAQDSDGGSGSEIYKWTDENGTVHFGERAPDGANAQSVDIKPPPVATGEPTIETAAEDGAGAPGDDALTPGAQARQERQAQQEAAAEQASIRQQLQAACTQAREQAVTLESSTNVLMPDGNGGSRRLDDNERLAMLAKSKEFIASNCD